jgi:hypothetical protein
VIQHHVERVTHPAQVAVGQRRGGHTRGQITAANPFGGGFQCTQRSESDQHQGKVHRETHHERDRENREELGVARSRPLDRNRRCQRDDDDECVRPRQLSGEREGEHRAKPTRVLAQSRDQLA